MLGLVKELWSELDPMLKDYREQAKALRASPGEFDEHEGVARLHTRLVATRQALDRTETILSELGLVLSRMNQLVRECQAAYDDKWAQVMETTRTGDYTSAQERNATYAVGAVNELANLRKAQKFQADVKETYDYVLLLFRGLDASRHDTETRVKIMNSESFLAR